MSEPPVDFISIEQMTVVETISIAEVTGGRGPAGTPGTPGGPGDDGKSAYDVAVENGFVGTQAAWLASLKGDPGDDGNPGPTAVSADAGNLLKLGADGLAMLDPNDLPEGGGGGITDHGALTGLSDDDHPQYLTNTRGDARYFTQAQVTSAITTAIDGLVAGAPGALDTLNELAAAINDDASFASAVTTALAGKAATAHAHTLADVSDAGTAAAEDVGAFATAAQGATADTAVQPGDLAAVATTGAYADLTGTPSIPVGLPATTGASTGDVLALDGDLSPMWGPTVGGSTFPPFGELVSLTAVDGTGTFDVPPMFVMQAFTFAGACRFRVYRTAAGRSADAARAAGTAYAGGAGLVYEYVATGAATDDLAPVHDYRASTETALFFLVDGGPVDIDFDLREV